MEKYINQKANQMIADKTFIPLLSTILQVPHELVWDKLKYETKLVKSKVIAYLEVV